MSNVKIPFTDPDENCIHANTPASMKWLVVGNLFFTGTLMDDIVMT